MTIHTDTFKSDSLDNNGLHFNSCRLTQFHTEETQYMSYHVKPFHTHFNFEFLHILPTLVHVTVAFLYFY